MNHDDHKRVTPEGRHVGQVLSSIVDGQIAQLVAEDEPDERCKSCAFRIGTVPNGCLQTMADAIKAVSEGIPFLCHQDPARQTICYGWYVLRVLGRGRTMKAPWEFSPPP